MLKDGEELPLRGEGADPPTKVPAKIREIITKHLSTENLTGSDQGEDMAATADTLREENRMLQVGVSLILWETGLRVTSNCCQAVPILHLCDSI